MTLTNVNHPERILRLGMFGEKRYFTDDRSLYEIVMLNANLVEGFSSGVATFVYSLNKPFIIDPMTHAFGHNPRDAVMKQIEGRWEVKKTIAKLADRYGAVISENVGRRAILPSDLSEEAIEELCKQTVDFQVDRIKSALGDDELKYMPDDFVADQLLPAALICPYFFMSDTTWKEWLPKNLALVRGCLGSGVHPGITRLAMLCLDGDLLSDNEAMNKISQCYHDLSVGGYCVWISNSPEWELSRREASALAKLVQKLSRNGERLLYKIYGGYFAALLWTCGASGFSFGPGYGEDRSVVPVGGGLPQPKYYLPPVHRRLDAAVVQAMLPETPQEFYKDVCDCPECQQVIRNSIDGFDGYMETDEGIDKRKRPYSYATQATRERSVRHYLYARDKEVKRIGSAKAETLRKLLNDAFEVYRPEFGDVGVSYLRAWAQTLADDS